MAPHPDDEVLAAGGLLPLAARSGARLHIWQLSDGENNPWPQRCLERRLRIDAAARARWGARRCGESRAGLARLGLSDAVVERWGWPDLGIGERAADPQGAALALLTERLRALRPDVLLLPGLADRHPDHGAAHVLLQLALHRAGLTPLCLDYVLHGRSDPAAAIRVELDAATQARKREAILEHASQTALSRGRMLAFASSEEHFHRCDRPVAPPPSVRLPWSLPRVGRSRLRLTVVWDGGARRWSWADAPLTQAAQGWTLRLPDAACGHGPVYARLDTARRGLWIFDRWGWAPLV
ncbi:hypothetical protein LF63_0106035 [Oleiagrimonas soli]|uniref:GlcNAc-PI de-N-acetylase n=1 Tax=Oleiagrimonas soli TaxID=1543381 RepID=A0A099CZD5_9GAMM|nr:hypothetical protein LF63_0106035 [Oleiagrimonas soli]